ncbi:MAG: putative quinol monooxygenase [Acidimicrobiales bacterium]
MFGLFGEIVAVPGARDALRDLLLEAAASDDMPGCVHYIVGESSSEPDALWVSEIWHSEADHAASLQLESTQALIKRGRPLIAGIREQIRFVPCGGKGLDT